MSARSNFIKFVRKSCEEVRAGRYFVKRGVINWASFDFSAHNFAIAILCDEIFFLKQNGISEMILTLEVGTIIPDSVNQPEIDDGVLDELIQDIESIVQSTRVGMDTLGDSVALQIDGETAKIVEFHDSSRRVQGIVATLLVKY